MCKGHNLHSDTRISKSESRLMSEDNQVKMRVYARRDNARYKNGDMK